MPGIKIKSIRPITSVRGDTTLSFVAAPDEPDYKDASYQRDLGAIDAALRREGIRVQPEATFQKSHPGGSWLTGDFLMQLSAFGSPVTALVTHWLTAKLGRKVRLKVGDVEIEAANLTQVDALIERVKELQAGAEAKAASGDDPADPPGPSI